MKVKAYCLTSVKRRRTFCRLLPRTKKSLCRLMTSQHIHLHVLLKNFRTFLHTILSKRGTVLNVVVAVVLTRPEQDYDGRCWESIFRFEGTGKPKRVTAPGRHAPTKPPQRGVCTQGCRETSLFYCRFSLIFETRTTKKRPSKTLRGPLLSWGRRITRTNRASCPAARCADHPRRSPSLRALSVHWDFLRANGRRIRRSPNEGDRVPPP